MTRAFVAVVPPPEILDAVEAAVAPVRDGVPGARFTTRDQWHLTLQFLGNQADLGAVTAALGHLAVGPGRVRLGGGGAFPSARRGRVLWLGLVEGAALLAQYAAAVGALVEPIGHPPETREYHAHLTLARLKAPGDLREAVEVLGDGPVGDPWTAAEIVLYESLLRREGARFEARARFPLSDGGS